jgi:hypothetical protein
VEGVAYFLGEDTGITHSYIDTTVTNGQRYFYAVTAYDRGVDSIQIYPSENAITVSQTLRGGTILPKNVVEVYPNPPVVGYKGAEVFDLNHTEGTGTGTLQLKILNSELVPDNHVFRIEFVHSDDSVRAQSYLMVDETAGDTLFIFGEDLNGEGTGPVGAGILPIINTRETIQIDSVNTKLINVSGTNAPYKIRYSPSLPINFRRPGFPENIDIIFSSDVLDTSIAGIGAPVRPVKFTVVAKTLSGDMKLKFRYRSLSDLGVPVNHNDYIEILTASLDQPMVLRPTWRLEVDTTGLMGAPVVPPTLGDKYELKITVPYSKHDKFTFITKSQSVDPNLAKSQYSEKPYVVPNPYVGAASFEPQRFAVSGRGERKIEFRNLPVNCTIRIYTLNGEIVQTLNHDGNINKGILVWNLRNRDQLEIAPGLYIFHVESREVGDYIGKFAIIK